MSDVIQKQEPAAPVSQARIFQERFAADAGENMRKTILRTIRRATILTVIALSVSMPHQMSYLVSKVGPHLHFEGWQIVDSVGMIMVAVSIPVLSDLLIINAIEQISSPAASFASKLRAMGALVVPLGVSGFVNFAASGPMTIKVLAAHIVFYVVISEILKFVKPDWRKIDKIEHENLVEVNVPDEPVRRPRFKSAREKVLHLLAENPDMSAKELSKRANVSITYVYSVRRDARAEASA